MYEYNMIVHMVGVECGLMNLWSRINEDEYLIVDYKAKL
jgi:hypothetical protein